MICGLLSHKILASVLTCTVLWGIGIEAHAYFDLKLRVNPTSPKPILTTTRLPLEQDYLWVPIIYRGNRIVAVGSHRLPIPFLLPPGVRPAGNSAIFGGPDPKFRGLAFRLFFKTKDEAAIKKWADKIPAEFPLPAGTYITPKWVRHRHKPSVNEWICATDVRTSFGWVNLIWGATPRPTQADFDSFGPAAYSFFYAPYQPGSPVRDETRQVSLMVTYIASPPK